MSESNATQVILTDDGIKIIKAQNTADNATGGVANLNDPNLMSVIEKQNNIGQFAGLTSQYNVIVQNAKDDGIDTTAVTTAYNNLNKFMTDVMADPDHASDVDRITYKKYQDAYNEELAKLQNSLQNNANNKFDSAASATSQAASTASQAFSQANSALGAANSATAEITKLSGDINLRVTKDGLIDQINLQAGNTLISSSGQLTLAADTIYFDTKKPVIIPSANIDSLLVGKKLTAADIAANTFSTNNGTFTVDKNGEITAKNMTLIGGTLTSPTINTSMINGSTINGTTFHGGNVIGNANNTARYYPMTITPDGAYKSTYFDSAVGLQSSVESGAINYKYRSMVGNNGQYLAYDSVINGQGFESHSGYTSTKDVIFSNTETITGYVNVTPDSGIYLYGPTQKINFAGNADNIGSNGVTMDAYGNIYAQANSAYWRIRDINGHEVANFGIDTANQRDISLYRDTQVGNLFLGVGHTIGMLDSSPLYFKKGDSNGRMLGLYAGAIHYENLIKSSLLSVKQDVKKADTAYWAQLVNSIDLATYQYKTDDNTSHIRLSSIVDDVNDTKQWQLPDVFVSRDEDGKLCGVDDSVLLNATLATVQEQQKEIDQLNGHNMELEARLNKLEAKLNG
ncbi:phage tail protein [Lactiplantibacillus plantarum]|uniref:phage tail protein n=1 Tax=Lactiplantibacillus plantarum TaxID=1590 RepID=UPI000CA2102A|nr:phage tail protein [Lactiplantibacillus plantarum]AUH37321.1 phage tail protein [Lactiplantibacillus plantarum]